jgi:hypothetical protein
MIQLMMPVMMTPKIVASVQVGALATTPTRAMPVIALVLPSLENH